MQLDTNFDRSMIDANTTGDSVFDFSKEIKIEGINVFGDETSMRSHLPTEEIATKFLNIVAGISSVSGFNQYTLFEKIIKFDFSKDFSSDEQSDIRSYFDSGKRDVDKTFIDADRSEKNVFYTWEFVEDENISTSLLQQIVRSLKNNIDALDSPNVNPLTHGTDNEEYQNVFKSVCMEIMKHHYLKLQEADYISNVTAIDSNKLQSQTNKLLDFIEKEADHHRQRLFIRSGDDESDAYIPHIYDLIMDFSGLSGVDSRTFKKIFFMCFYPYWYFNFIMKNVAQQEQTASDGAPRYFFVQRMSVLAVYMAMFFMCQTLLDNLDKGSDISEFQEIVGIISKLNDNLLVEEGMVKNNMLTYESLQMNTERTHFESQQLQRLKAEIAAIQKNLSKVAIQEVTARPRVKRLYIFLILWSVFFGISVILSVLFLFILQRRNAFYLTMIISAAIIFLGWIIDVVVYRQG